MIFQNRPKGLVNLNPMDVILKQKNVYNNNIDEAVCGERFLLKEVEKTELKNKRKYVSAIEKINDKSAIAYEFCVKADALRTANLFSEAVTRYLNSILVDRNNADSYYGLGICYKHLGNTDKAIENLKKALKLRELDANIYYELGICYIISGEVCLAMENLIKSLKINPENLNAQIQLAIAHEIVDEKDMALMIYQKIIETNPTYIQAYNHKSALLMSIGNYFEASKLFNKILKLNPEYTRAYLGIGICFDKMGKGMEAQRYYKKFLQYKPKSHHAPFVKARIKTLKALAPHTKAPYLELVNL